MTVDSICIHYIYINIFIERKPSFFIRGIFKTEESKPVLKPTIVDSALVFFVLEEFPSR